jgi:GTPase SAR1 family protein
VCLQIWDTAGQERYHSVSQLFFRDADVAFVCYDAGSEDSVDAVPGWVDRVKREVPDCEFMFVATKGDLLPDGGAERVRADAERLFASYLPRGYYLTSAMNREGVDKLFSDTAEAFMPKQKAKRQGKDLQSDPPAEKKVGGCC